MAGDEKKEHFYDQLQSVYVVEKTSQHDMVLMLGDLNAKIGQDNNIQKERTMGRQGLGTMNNNGQRLYQLCSENNMVIIGSVFVHKDIHKYTWTSPDGKTCNQIDHVIINQKWRTSLLGVKTCRGADVGSDHQLVRAKVQLKL